jgi:hypothetical protein
VAIFKLLFTPTENFVPSQRWRPAQFEPTEKFAPRRRVARWHIFQTQNPDVGKFCRVLQWKMLEYFMVIWYIFPLLYQEKSGNPA